MKLIQENIKQLLVLITLSIFVSDIYGIENGKYIGSYLICDDGFKEIGGQCQKLPEVTNGKYVGSYLVCDDGFKEIGGQCQKLPEVNNGKYVGSYLVCDDGFKEIGGQCQKLPEVTKGKYVGSYLVCDDGFIEISGQCQKLPEVTNGKYVGNYLVCNDGYDVINNNCQAVSSLPSRSHQIEDNKNLLPLKKYYNYETGAVCAENGSCYGDVSEKTDSPKTISVKGYFRRDGNYVRGHYRSKGK